MMILWGSIEGQWKAGDQGKIENGRWGIEDGKRKKNNERRAA